MKNGLVQIYTGDGKGKTTAAFGLALRALGNNMKVIIVQFLKGRESGELILEEKFNDLLTVYNYSETKKFTWEMNESELGILRNKINDGINLIKSFLKNSNCDILILDEILGLVSSNLIDESILIEFIKLKPDTIELIMTGRNASLNLIEQSDLVTEMKNIKHPYDKNINQRKGIEF